MVAVVQKTFCYIESSHACGFVCKTVKYELMLANTLNRQEIQVFKFFFHIVRIECGKWSHEFYVFFP